MPTTPTHADATGYINDLTREIGLPWFSEMARMATTDGQRQLPRVDLDRIVLLMHGGAPAIPASTAAASHVTPAPPALGHIEWLGQFSNFKKLPNTLMFKPAKHVTVVFGKNGSGKTSLCDAFKALADAETPKRPLGNVRSPSATPSTFKIKFSGEAAERAFSQTYGTLSGSIRYFDTSIAKRNIQVAVAPERVVQLAPFKLGSIDVLRGYVAQLKTELTAQHTAVTQQKQAVLERLRGTIGQLPGSTFANPNLVSKREIDIAIADATAFPGQQILSGRQQALADMEKASTTDGLKVLLGEIRDIERLLPAMVTLARDVDILWESGPGSATAKLRDALTRQQALSTAVVPAGVKTEVFVQFLKSARTVCDFETANLHTPCPLCRQEITASGEALFKQYHATLTGVVETEIAGHRKTLENAKRLTESIPRRIPEDIGTMAIDDALRQKILISSSALISHAKPDRDATLDSTATRDAFQAIITTVTEMRDNKKKAYTLAESNAAGQMAAIAKTKAEVDALHRQSLHAAALTDLRKLTDTMDGERWLMSAIAPLTPLSAKVSAIRRKAHDELVLETFVDRLNAEYLTLAECRMADFGVTLVPKTTGRGEEGEILLEGQVCPDGTRGGRQAKAMEDVLSEGEQRLHALALFFAEVETSPHQVVVFDDPASSFDYDRVENYGIRLRNFATNHPNRQLIILTHCWEFFVHLQQILKAPLSPSVQVLESCAVVAEYADSVKQLKISLDLDFRAPDPLTNEQKANMAGKMRRLIEEVVNEVVFAHQRHQYKNKGVQQPSAFLQFMRVVPLTATEAREFGDLYRKVCHDTHADWMNNVVSANKTVLRTRYDAILALDAQIRARVPPP
jgi:energy-coupling factor transporter ATP-binding protein EcfA2